MSQVIDASERLNDTSDNDATLIRGRGLSDLAIAKLHSSGISPEAALAAGIYSVENARDEVHPEFDAAPALVFPYCDVNGRPIFIERQDGLQPFVRVRYLADPLAGFAKLKRPKYMQLKGSGVHAYFPRVYGIDWQVVANDPAAHLIFTEGELKALAGCLAGVATIGLGGVDSFLRRSEQDR